MLIKKLIAEFIGTCFLVMVVVGSGIMAENLTSNEFNILLANTIVTGAPVTIVLARRILNSFEVRFSAMMPEPTTTITKKQVPINSAMSFFISTLLFMRYYVSKRLYKILTIHKTILLK